MRFPESGCGGVYPASGTKPDAKRKKLREFVARAHKQRRKVRFWAPETEAAWKELLAADVDSLNADKLKELEKCLRER